MEPENNIEMILEGVVSSKSDNLFLVVGNYIFDKNTQPQWTESEKWKEEYQLDSICSFHLICDPCHKWMRPPIVWY